MAYRLIVDVDDFKIHTQRILNCVSSATRRTIVDADNSLAVVDHPLITDLIAIVRLMYRALITHCSGQISLVKNSVIPSLPIFSPSHFKIRVRDSSD